MAIKENGHPKMLLKRKRRRQQQPLLPSDDQRFDNPEDLVNIEDDVLAKPL